MADFCNQCAAEHNFHIGDLAGLITKEDVAKDLCAITICEGCGLDCRVDHEGNCISFFCLKQHGVVGNG